MKAVTKFEIEGQVTTINDVNLDETFRKFFDVSAKSYGTYKKCLSALRNYLNVNEINAPVAEDIRNWRDSLMSEGKSPSTVNLYIQTARRFFAMLRITGIYSGCDCTFVKGVKDSRGFKKDCLTKSQGRKLLATFNETSIAEMRDKLMVELMMFSGLRTIEISNARVCDLNERFGRLTLSVLGKGRNDRVDFIRIPDAMKKLLYRYLASRGVNASSTAPLFPSFGNRNLGGKMSTTMISRIVKRHYKTAGFGGNKRLTAHSLRHSACTAMLLGEDGTGKNGVDIDVARQVMRHSSIDVTRQYAHYIDAFAIHAEDTAAAYFLNE